MSLLLNTAQAKIAETATWQACSSLPAYAHNFANVTIRAKAGNSAAIVFCASNSGSVAADGTGTGFILDAGACVTVSTTQFNTLYAAGTANDVFSAIGN
jgi:hypothetical protein